MVHQIAQFGLKWTEELFHIVPTWTVEPRIDIIKQLALPHLPVADYNIEYFASGAFNKLYRISRVSTTNADSTCGEEEYLMRVALPVYPYFKTASEVATLSYLADHTSIPVPRVLAHNSCASNDALGFEWILMTRLEGVPLRSLWSTPSLPWRGRVELTKTIAGYIDQMRMIRSQLLGNLYFTRDADDAQGMLAAFGQPNASPFEILEEDPKFSVGPICAIPFFYGDRIHLASDRGPWNSARAWIEAQLHLHITCVKKAIERISGDNNEDADEDDMEELSGRLTSAEELLNLFTDANENTFNFATPSGHHLGKETFVLHHDDLSTNNILIDPVTHIVTGIVDWECISFVPRWKAHRMPQFLEGPDIDSIMYRHNYGGDVPQVPPPPDENEGDELRKEFRERLEQMLLRDIFVRTSSVSLCPEGYEHPPEGETAWGRAERVFERQVMLLEGMWMWVSDWVKRISKGGPVVLKHKVGQDLYIWPEV